MREISYCEAINEALVQEMEVDPDIFIYGIGSPDHKKIFGTTSNIVEKFGHSRCLETPLCEDGLAGFGLGAAINGLKPVFVNIRVDFLLLAMNQLSNMISSCRYMSDGNLDVPFVIRAVIGRGWGQGSQHSKSCQSVFAHFPGLKVIMPTTPYDVKGMLISAMRDNNPVIVLEHRWLYWQTGEVPEESYEVQLGCPKKIRDGEDITVVATSWMNVEALKAAEVLEAKRGITVEIIDPRTISSFDNTEIIASVEKTKNCIVADNDWLHCGFSAELATTVYEKCLNSLKKPITRIGFSNVPCPTSRHLENEFYPNAENIIRAIEKTLEIEETDLSDESFYSHENRFKGPF